MAELPRVPLRAGAVALLALVAAFEVTSLLRAVASLRRLRARVVQDGEQRLAEALPRLAPLLAEGGSAGWKEAVAAAGRLEGVSEVELIDDGGVTLSAHPAAAPVRHFPEGDDQRRLAAGGRLAVLAQQGATLRLLLYLPLGPPGGQGFLRLALATPDLEDELREQQRAWLGHLAALAALVAVALAVLRRESPAAGRAPRHALDAYEQALESLRDRGERIAASHELERRRMAGALQDKEAMARAGELTAGIVHEVRNGLGTIVGYARLIERSASAGECAAAARSIREECDGLETVVRRFTDFVRLEELRLGPTRLGPLLRRVASREWRGHAGVELDVAGLGEPREVAADEELLERAFENLVRNAVQAAVRGGGHVRLSARETEIGCELRIEDDGPGLGQDHPGEIRPFYTTRPGGLGLGLPLAQKIVRLHGGQLRLEPREPRGVAVSVYLPRNPAVPAEPEVT